MRRVWVSLSLLLALSAFAAPAKYCEGLLGKVDVDALPAGLKELMARPGAVRRLEIAPQSPETATFFSQIATSIESGGPNTFTLEWAKRSTVVATVTPLSATQFAIRLVPSALPKSGELLDLHALQFGIAQSLFERIPAKKLSSIRIQWSNETKVFLDAEETMNRLGYIPEEVRLACGRGRKMIFAAGVITGTGGASFLGLAAGPQLDDMFGDGQDLQQSAIWTAIGTGAAAGAGLTTIATLRCRPETRDASYFLEISRYVRKAAQKKRGP